MSFQKEVLRQTEGKNQLGAVIGKPKPGDIVKVKYEAFAVTVKKNGKTSNDRFIDTFHLGSLVSFKIVGNNQKGEDEVDKDGNKIKPHEGLYNGLNQVLQTMNLGEEVNVTFPPELAFGDRGLSRYYDPSAGFWKHEVGILGTQMPNDPNAPADHHGRNPLCVAYLPVQPGQDVYLERLALMEINGHRREIPEYSCCDCIVSSITGAFGLNSGTYAT